MVDNYPDNPIKFPKRPFRSWIKSVLMVLEYYLSYRNY